MIGIVDYGAGNLRSVKKAVDFVGAPNRILDGPDGFDGVEKLILPGVGAFAAAIEGLRERGIFQPVAEWLEADRPFLGICLGMQVLFEGSEEAPGVRGFGLFAGDVHRFRHDRVPQIGWNRVFRSGESTLLQEIDDGAYFYFLHGYHVRPADDSIVIGRTEYGLDYPSAVASGRRFAVQFHPEKSSSHGQRLLRNWIEL